MIAQEFLCLLKIFFFYCCSSTVVSIFPPLLFPATSPPPLNLTSIWLYPCVLYKCSLMTLPLLSPVIPSPSLWSLSVCSLFQCFNNSLITMHVGKFWSFWNYSSIDLFRKYLLVVSKIKLKSNGLKWSCRHI